MVGSKTKKSALEVSFMLIGINPEYISPMSKLTSGKESTIYSTNREPSANHDVMVTLTFGGIVQEAKGAIRCTWTQKLLVRSSSYRILCPLLLSL